MARRTLEDIREEIKAEEQKANFRRKDNEINEKYRQRYNNLLEEERILVDKITASRKAEVRVGNAREKPFEFDFSELQNLWQAYSV